MKKLVSYSGKYQGLMVLSLVLIALATLLSFVPFISIYLVVKEVLAVAPDMSRISYATIGRYGVVAVIGAIASLLVKFLALMCSHIVAFQTAKNIKSTVLHHLLTLPLGFFTTHSSGAIRKIIDINAGDTESFLAHQLPNLASLYTMLIALPVVLLLFDWRLGLLILVMAGYGFVLQKRMMSIESGGFLLNYQNALEEMNQESVEYIRGISVVKVFGQTVQSFTNFYLSIMRYKKFVLDYTMASQRPLTLFTTVTNSSFLLLIPAGVILGTTAGDSRKFVLNFIFYLLIMPVCAGLITSLLYSTSDKMIADMALAKIQSLLDEQPLSVAENPQVPKSYEVTFEHVSFAYEEAGRLAVNDSSFTIKEGETGAFVGPSGGGKSTTAILLPRFYDVTKGCIKIGGVDIREIAPEVLAEKVAFVFQDSKLLKKTLVENIKMGRKNATMAEVDEAIRVTRCEDIVAKLPRGLDTVIGEEGSFLSGGEVQRIALARAVLKDAPIIVLDEATAFADAENEYKIQLGIQELMKGKTVLMIAHRLSTIRHTDCIFVMKQGAIVERGTHKLLLEKKGVYSTLWGDYQKSVAWSVKEGGVADVS